MIVEIKLETPIDRPTSLTEREMAQDSDYSLGHWKLDRWSSWFAAWCQLSVGRDCMCAHLGSDNSARVRSNVISVGGWNTNFSCKQELSQNVVQTNANKTW